MIEQLQEAIRKQDEIIRNETKNLFTQRHGYAQEIIRQAQEKKQRYINKLDNALQKLDR